MGSYQSLGEAELIAAESRVERELAETMFRLRMGQQSDTSKPGKLRKEIARIRTEVRARELQAGKPKDYYRNLYGARPVEAAKPESSASGFLSELSSQIEGSAE